MNNMIKRLTLFCVISISSLMQINAQPQIHVIPDSLSFNLKHGDSISSYLTIQNLGTDTLRYSIGTSKVVTIQPLAYRRSESQTSSANGIKVLIVASDYATQITSILLSYPDIAVVDYFFSRDSTPTLERLKQYDVVLTFSGWNHFNSTDLGNVFANYVDAGGTIVFGEYSFYSTTGSGIAGRIVTDGYTPFVSDNKGSHNSVAQLGWYDTTHPIMQGVSSASDRYRDYVSLQTGAQLIASWSDGEEFIAVKGPVVAINSYFADYPGWTGDIGLIVHNSIMYAASKRWLRAADSSGSLAPSASVNINLHVSARDIIGGLYREQISITSNDTSHPVVNIPTKLSVTGNPTLILSKDTLSFRQYFLGYTDTLILTIRNAGTDILHISNITSSSTEFSVLEPIPFSVGTADSIHLHIKYNRSTLGSLNETLTITSNDTLNPIKVVHLSGSAIPVPSIVVSPDSIHASLAAGDTSVTSFTIQNTGAGTLSWSINNFKSPLALSLVESIINEMKQTLTGSKQNAVKFVKSATQSPGSLNVALITIDYPEYETDVQTNLMATGFFNSVSIIDIGSVTLTLNQLKTFDAVLVWADQNFTNVDRLGDTLAAYVDAGGGVVVGVYATTPNTIGGKFSASNYWAMIPSNVLSGQAYLGNIYLPTHPLMSGVVSFDGGASSARPGIDSLVNGSFKIADWSDGKPLIVERIINGVSRVDLGFFPPSSQIAGDSWNITTDGAKILANALKHVAHRFLTVSPDSGTIIGVGSQSVSLRISAQALIAGNYRNQILIESNDPAKPAIGIPVSAIVSGNPKIAVSSDTLKYGTGFLGYPDTLSLMISNQGTDSLRIVSMISANAQYSVVGSTAFSLPVSGRRQVQVAYSRANLGTANTTLTISCNDTTRPTYTVQLLGNTISPPIIQVHPDSLQFSMTSGGKDSSTITISNTGATDLNWNANVYIGMIQWPQVEAVAKSMRSRAVTPKQSSSKEIGYQTRTTNNWSPESAVKVYKSERNYSTGRNIALVASDDMVNVAANLLSTGKFATITTIDAGSLTPLLEELLIYDAVLVWSNNDFGDPVALGNTLADYVDQGGGVVTAPMAGRYGTSWIRNQHIQGRFESENYYVLTGGLLYWQKVSLGTVYFPSHPVMYGVTSLTSDDNGYHYTSGLAVGAVRIADWNDGTPLVAEKTIHGVVERIDLSLYPPATIEYTTLMANALSLVGKKFVTISPFAGILSAGSSQDIKLNLDASKLNGAVYTNTVLIESNDPARSHIKVPVTVTVKGNPAIAFVPDTLDFNDGFIGQSDTLSVRITNKGTDTLVVSSLSTNNPEYVLLDPAGFKLGVWQHYDVRIRFIRSAPSVLPALLTLSTNDTNHLIDTFVIKGTSSLPPTSAGNAVRTDGLTQYIEVSYNAAKQLFTPAKGLEESFTIELWINPQSAGPLVCRQQCNAAYPSIEMMLGGSAPSYDFNLILNPHYYNNADAVTFSVPNSVPQNKWSHLTAAYDNINGSIVRLYVDGVLMLERSYRSMYDRLWFPSTNLFIMGIPAPYDGCWSMMTQGIIDEVRYWNTARTQEQIKAGMHSSFSAAEKELVGYWRFDDGIGATATDNSGEGNTAYLRNDASWRISDAPIHTGGIYKAGRLIVSADASPTSDAGYANAPTNATSTFVTNLASLFANGMTGRFLIYSDNQTFGTQFRNTLTSHGHIVDQSLSPISFNQYDGVFVGGNITVSRDSLYNYIRHGGNIYLATGALTDTTEEQFWNPFTKMFGIQLNPKQGIVPKALKSFETNPLFSGVSGLYTYNPSGINLVPGYLPRTKIISSYGNENYFAMYDETIPYFLPEVPLLSNPSNGSTFSATSQTFNWGGNFYSPIIEYRIEIASDASFSNVFKDTTILASNVTLNDLARNTTYYWRVSAIDSAGRGKPSDVWSFRTIPDVPPAIPVLATPKDSSINLIINPVLSWNSTVDASVYQVQVSKDSLFSSLAVNDSGITGALQQLPQLETKTKYFWRVRAINLVGESGWSTIWSFTTERLPDLQVTQVQVPSSAFSGQSLEVRWVITNTGDGGTNAPAWFDRVYLCPDSVFDVGISLNLGDFQNPAYLNSGEAYSNSATVHIPNGLSGTYFVFISADINNQLRETHENNNDGRNTTSFVIHLTPPPDLQVVQLSTAKNTFSGENINVYWTVKNAGTGTTVTNSWQDAVYLSSDSILNTQSDRLLATVDHNGVLGVDSSYFASASVTIPYTVYGKQYVIVYTDVANNEYEYSFEDNNTKVSDSISVTLTPPADLVPLSAIIPSTAGSGKQVLINWTVQNQGANPTREIGWYDKLYLCPTPTFIRDSAISIGTYSHTGVLYPESTYTVSHNVRMPNALQGSYYVYVDVDHGNNVFEYTYKNNNMLRSTNQITVSLSPWPDLRVISVGTVDTITAGHQLSVNWTVKNNGTAKTDQSYWIDEVYISPNATWDPHFATVLRSIEHQQALDTGATYMQTTTITIPTNLVGLYYIYVFTDAYNQVYEYTDEGNNVTRGNELHVGAYPPIDLAVDSVSIPGSGSSGQSIDIAWHVKNIGEGETIVGAWDDAIYLSTDTVLSIADDILLGKVTRYGTLSGGADYSRKTSVKLPNGVSGNYYVFVATDLDNLSADINLGNNYKRSPSALSIVLTPSPDLAVTAAGDISDGTIGQPLTVYWSVQNEGAGQTSGGWYDAVYLSTDSILQSSDMQIGIRYFAPQLGSGSSYVDTLRTYIPQVAAGDYYIIVKTDNRDDVYEGGSEANNVKVIPITLTLPLPSDLIVTTVGFPDSATVGDAINIGWYLRNQGPNQALGTITDAVYISSDSLWDIDDPLLGIDIHTIFLLPGASMTFNMKANLTQAVLADSFGHAIGNVPGIKPGNYHIIVRTNIRNNIRETDNTNNIFVSGNTLKVIVPEIQLGTPVVSNLHNDGVQFYRVNVPAGEVLQISLNSNNSSASNELYVKYGSVPSRKDFDFTYDKPFESDQKITVPESQEGTYYIMARCDRVNGSQADTILASIVKYTLSNITPSKAGNTGQVTLKIEGAKLNDKTLFFIQPTGDTSAAHHIYSLRSTTINPTLAYATFDLKDKAPGYYDLYASDRFSWLGADLHDTSNITYGWQTLEKGAAMAGSFEVVSGGEAHLFVKLVAPSAVAANRDYVLTIDVINVGNVDAKAPVIELSNSENTPICTNLPYDPEAIGSRRVLVLGPGYWHDVFAPGERSTIRFFARSTGRGTIKFSVEDQTFADSVSINWDAFEQDYRDSSSADEWAATWSNFKSIVGSSFGELHDVLRQVAMRRYPDATQTYYSVSNLFEELFGYARNNVFDVSAKISSTTSRRVNYTDSISTILSNSKPIPIPNSTQSTLLCPNEWDFWQSQKNDNSIPWDNKWCGTCGINTACLATTSLPVVHSALLYEQTLEAIAFRTPPWSPKYYMLECLERYFLGLGDKHWSSTDPIAIDIRNSQVVFDHCRTIYNLMVPKIKHFMRSDQFNCGQGLYNIDQFLDINELKTQSGFERSYYQDNGYKVPFQFGGEGGPSHGLVRTLGSVIGKYTGYVTLVKVGNTVNGRTKFEVKMNLTLHIDDIYKFCYGSGTAPPDFDNLLHGSITYSIDYVFFLLRQFESCGLVLTYHNIIDVDTSPGITYITCGGSNSENKKDDRDNDRKNGGRPRPPGAPKNPHPDDKDINQFVSIVNPGDPNDIVGPAGHGDEKWVGLNQPLSYTIHYENDPKIANAPAQVVTINLELDSTLDARTFRVGEFGFGNQVFSVPENRAYISQRLDLRDSLGLYVDVNAGIDITTNKAFWIFRSIDPKTGEVPTNPFLGYLLLNDSLHHGEGFVTYSVKPKKISKTKDLAHAHAQIVFDQENPIDTPPFFNTIDAGIPSSKVDGIADKIDSVTYRIHWTGQDDSTGSGIESYSIYISKNDKAFNLWLTDVPDTSAVFVGERDSTYKFFSIAQDFAGNVEPMKSSADATLVITDVKDKEIQMPKEYSLEQNYPNPFNPTTTFHYNLPIQSRVTLIIYDVLGREVKRLVDGIQDAGFKSLVWNSTSDAGYQLASGVYFYRLEATSISDVNKRFAQVKKMLLIK